MLKSTFLLLFVSWASANVHERLQLLQVYPQTDEERFYLEQLKNEHDVWYSSEDRYDVLLTSSNINWLLSSLQKRGIASAIVNDDLDRDIKEEFERLSKNELFFDYDDFNNLTSIYQEMDKIAAKCIPGFVCAVDIIGTSVEKQPIKRLKISKNVANRKVIWLDATTHAREWLTTATTFKIMKHLQDKYKVDPTVTSMLDKYDWHIIPVVNPDGYIYTWKGSRLWRKNRSINSKPTCPGVDLNRNADSAWGAVGASADPCSETYRGPSVASEPETQALQKHIKSLGSNIIEFISLHAYGNYWLIPFGHLDDATKKCYVAPDAAETLRVADAAANAIEKVFNTKWKRGPSCNTIYPNSGGMIDYAKAKAGVKYTTVPEVRGNGFIVPPAQIEPSFKEIWAGIVASIGAIEKKPFLDIIQELKSQ
ncbi:hypothetical protein HELRODRAFT_107037 [Helobdella robusta]|uniref:Peptidase M14 domain-containing protein n=1 Tax=Helobdella robusta TaxID=6412 RepID=T1EE67_HELRO|nr:hypothetical protein HELRODRAFT_107037 [Helobdella robusta]ESN98861.1 hypothetical protein HELRODRAFT_107037 [Helobdella robusta]